MAWRRTSRRASRATAATPRGDHGWELRWGRGCSREARARPALLIAPCLLAGACILWLHKARPAAHRRVAGCTAPSRSNVLAPCRAKKPLFFDSPDLRTVPQCRTHGLNRKTCRPGCALGAASTHAVRLELGCGRRQDRHEPVARKGTESKVPGASLARRPAHAPGSAVSPACPSKPLALGSWNLLH
jgi:hypothetical protein